MQDKQSFDVLIIGGGVIGGLIARELSKYQVKAIVLEKDNDVCNATSAANSAIVHSGYDPIPGTLKAYYNVKSVPMFKGLCEELNVEYEQIGSLTIASEKSQMKILFDLEERAKQNKVPVKILSGEEVLKLEPNITSSVVGALFAPTAGIVNPFQLTIHAFENAIDNGIELALNEEVVAITPNDNGYLVTTKKGHLYYSKCVINAAGVYSDKIAEMVGDDSFQITPRKGSYYVLDHFDDHFVNHVIFPLPSEKGKGILITPANSRNYLVGPSSEFVDAKDEVVTDTLTMQNIQESAKQLIPSIPFNQVIRVFSGLRATPSSHDFVIGRVINRPGFINVAGIESPGLAAAPAIAEYVVHDLIVPDLALKEKPNFNPALKPYYRIKDLTKVEKEKLYKQNADYADIICSCELVSKAEIIETLNRSCPPQSLKAVKKRTRAGFGKCQGGFCQTKIIKLLADYYALSPLEVNYDSENSPIFMAESKQ